jgi:uncharacterized membrane protein YphA (DoxX/SURF4 family)
MLWMSISNRTARPLLSAIFISGGLDALRNPEGKVKSAERVTAPLARRFSFIPDDTALLVRVNGGVQVVAASLLSVGKFRRTAALALIGSTLPTTFAGHPFWAEVDEEKRAQQQTHFLKNLGVLGGLILAATDTDGAPSLGWKVAQHRHHGNDRARTFRRFGAQHARTALEHTIQEVGVLGSRVRDGAATAVESGARLGDALLSDVQERLATS